MSTNSRRQVLTPSQDAAESGRIILRDGSIAEIRPATPADGPFLAEFFGRLNIEARIQRFHSASLPSGNFVAAMCDDCDPAAVRTLLVMRIHEAAPRIVATGTYVRHGADVAEAAFAVDDSMRGKGLGTVLLERLALLAVRHGYRRFWALTRFDNSAMREVFRDSGFVLSETSKGSEIEIDLSLIPDANTVARFEWRDRVATVASLRPFFRPNAVAVVGASRDPASIGYRTLQAVVANGFCGPVFPVNPRAYEILGLKACGSVRDLPQQFDLAILTVPREVVLNVVDDCAARGVRAVVIITAGFAEVRGDGIELQKELVRRVRGHGMRLIGPNCMGILNVDPAVSLNASFSPVYPPPGRVAMSSQSGALGLAVLAAAKRLNLGLSTFVSVGNKADVSGNDLLQYWEEDPGTDVILLYLESFGNPRRFARIARRVSGRKPIVAIKSGRGKSGARAAGSHTAALASKDVAVDALFRQTGVIRADTLEEMFDLAAMLGSQPLPQGNRVGIVTNAGGPGILCADACESGGLVIPELSAITRAQLASFLSAAASVGNPVDMVASTPPQNYARVIEMLVASGEIDALIVIYIPVGIGDPQAYAAAISDGLKQAREAGATAVPVLGCWMSGPGEALVSASRQEAIPEYAFPEAPARVLARVTQYAAWRTKLPGVFPEFSDIDLATAVSVCRDALNRHGPGWLSMADAMRVLRAMKLPVAPGGVAVSEDEAVQLADALGYPVALKLVSRTLIHKTEAGGVHLNLKNAEAVRRAFAEMRTGLTHAGKPEAMEGALMQPMAAGGIEVMVGMTLDPAFGPLLAFGLGGVLVEVLQDVSFRIAPLTDRDAEEMIASIRGLKLLQGYRGRPPADLGAIKYVLLRISRLVEELPEIAEIDLNPIFAAEHGCTIVDARIRVE
jgi:acetyl coenzyme A synthetase (ADP forming)-like protein